MRQLLLHQSEGEDRIMRRKLWGIFICIGVIILLLGDWSFADAGQKKIGLIYSTGGRGDLSFCDASYAGANKACEEERVGVLCCISKGTVY